MGVLSKVRHFVLYEIEECILIAWAATKLIGGWSIMAAAVLSRMCRRRWREILAWSALTAVLLW